MDLTILIPTINRADFVERALTYYYNKQFTGKIMIGDSSDTNQKNQCRYIVKGFKDSLDIDYHYFDTNSFPHDAAVLKRLGEFVKTNYVTFTGDDDFIIPEGAKECIDFLNSHNDYIAAHGIRMNFELEQPVYGRVVDYGEDPGYDWDFDAPLDRWRNYMRVGLSTTSFIHRAENWRKYYANVTKSQCRYVTTELIICSTTALLGKVKKLPVHAFAFQRRNPQRLFSFDKYTLFDLINSPHWSKASQIFMDTVISYLSPPMSKEDAKKEVYKEFWHHCLNVMINQFNYNYDDARLNEWAGDYKKPIDLTTILPEGHRFWDINNVLLSRAKPVEVKLGVHKASHAGHVKL